MAMLDADKEGFLRSATSLIQTIGCAAQTPDAHVIKIVDSIRDTIRTAIDETATRREIQQNYK